MAFGIAMVQALTGLTHLIMGLQDLSLCFSVDPGQFVVSLGTTFLKECGSSQWFGKVDDVISMDRVYFCFSIPITHTFPPLLVLA